MLSNPYSENMVLPANPKLAILIVVDVDICIVDPIVNCIVVCFIDIVFSIVVPTLGHVLIVTRVGPTIYPQLFHLYSANMMNGNFAIM